VSASLAIAFALSVALTVFLAQPDSRRIALWGAIWGLAYGFLLLAPLMLDVHFLRPALVHHWLIVDAYFVLLFSLFGAVLAFVTTLPITIPLMLRRVRFRYGGWSACVAAAAVIPPVYLASGALMEWVNFGRLPALHAYWPAVRFAGPAYALLMVLVIACRPSNGTHRRLRLDERQLQWFVVGLAATAALAVPLRIEAARPQSPPASAPLVKKTAARPLAPLLVIGLDGGNWRTLRPLIEQRRVPTLARMAETGVVGEIEALWPPYWSAPAWGAILTGHSPDEIGVHEDLSVRAAGLPRFELPLTLNVVLNPLLLTEAWLTRIGVLEVTLTPREQIKGSLVWERLSRSGVKTAVIRFPFTHPPAGQSDYVVSNWATTDLWDLLGVKAVAAGDLGHPTEEVGNLIQRSRHESADIARQSRLIVEDWPQPADAVVNPLFVLRRATTIALQMQDVTKELIERHPDLSVTMLYIAGFDNVSHAFWQYRFPEDFPLSPPAERDVAHLGPVIDRYLELVDSQISELMAAFPVPPNVLVVSDHGEGPSDEYPPWKGWHTSPGLFVAAGPDIAPGSELMRVSYYDVLPTILELKGFQNASDLRGHSVLTVR
jgi:predicted AlkP superfamily phosphohydrolase/phosphomutase